MVTNKILKQIRHSKKCKAALQLSLDKAAPTIQRYLDNNDIMLTTDTALNTIAEHLKVDKSEILIKQQA